MTRLAKNKMSAFALLVADVYDAAGVLRRFGEAIAATQGQTQARWQLLSVASVGDWTVPAAAERLGTSRQAVQRIANELVDEGLTEFVDNPRHRRSPFLRLTADGTSVLHAITAEARRRQGPLIEGLGDIDLTSLVAGVQGLSRAVRAELDRDRHAPGS